MITATPSGGSNFKAEYRYGYIWLISVVAALGGLGVSHGFCWFLCRIVMFYN